MILRSLRLKGFRGLRAGIGLDEVSINFDNLPDGLIAIVGPNGSGKTTLLDNMHPFRIMPYKLRRAKNWSPGSFNFYDQCFGPDAAKELVFGMGGKLYKSLIQIDADRKKQECYLFELDAAGDWRPLVDGATKNYDEAIERIVGSPSLFFSSVFRSQGAKNLSEYSRGDIMGIISELLNIDHIKEQGDKAKKVADALKDKVTGDLDRLSAIAAKVTEAEGLRSTIEEKNQNVLSLQRSVVTTQSDIDTLSGQISDVEKKQAAQAADQLRAKEMAAVIALDKKSLVDITCDIETRQQRGANEDTALVRQYQSDSQELNADRVALEGERASKKTAFDLSMTDLQTKIARAEKIVSGAADIRAKVVEEETTSAALVAAKGWLVPLEELLVERESDDVRFRQLQGRLSELDAKIASGQNKHDLLIQGIKTSITYAEQDAAKLDGIPCGQDLSASCKFTMAAMQSRESLVKLEQDLRDIGPRPAEFTKLHVERQELAAEIDALGDIPGRIAEIRGKITVVKSEISALEANLAELAKWTKLVPELDLAESNLKQWSADVEALQKNAVAEAQVLVNKLDVVEGKIIQRNSAHSERLAALASEVKADVANLEIKKKDLSDRVFLKETELFELEMSLGADLASELVVMHNQLCLWQQNLDAIKSNIRTVEIEIGALSGRLETLAAEEKAGIDIRARVGRYNSEIAYWVLLARACSNNGIVALELDDAGPGIAVLTNDLLNACYGPRFSVRLETQSLKADGSLKEDFDFTIFDAETDEVKSILEMSGGQVTWIENAITRGICLFNVERAGKVYGTVCSDEADGALDAERKDEFFGVKMRALELGTHSREIFITQSPELWDRSDGKIILKKGEVVLQ